MPAFTLHNSHIPQLPFQVNKEHAASTQASILPSSSSASAHRPLALVNGEGDASSVTGSVVQRLWGRVLALARDVPPPPPAAEERAGAEEEPPTPSTATGYGGDDGRIVRR